MRREFENGWANLKPLMLTNNLEHRAMKVRRMIAMRSLVFCFLAFAALSIGSPLRPSKGQLDQDPDVNDAFDEDFPLIEDPTVELDYGRLRGKTVSGIHHFFGIPFAAPPVGPLRLRPPQPPLPMAPGATLNVTKHGPSCMQVLFRLTAGPRATIDEDCLTLDIWIPEKTDFKKDRLPVMVWIYGGAFLNGGTSNIFYDGDAMIKAHDAPMIFVSFNYRLAAFGFLGSQTLLEQNSTNLGLLDQVAALEWILKYIHLFGGNPEDITAAGESAGAISIGTHLLANNGNQPYFQKAVLESGTVLHAFPTVSDSQTVFDKLLNTTGCSQTKDTIGCLQQVPADVILTATEPDFFSIVMDGLYVQRQPVESLLMGKFSRVPLLIGTNTNEGTYFTYKTIKSEADIAKYYNDTVPYINEQQRKELMRLYPTASYKAPYLAAADVVGDRLFQCPTNLMARVYADEGIPVFKYRWHHQMTLSKPFTGNASLGSFHFSEVPFVFNLRFLFLTHQEFILGRILNGMWVQFVVRGNPNLRQDPFDNIIQWPLYTKFSDYEQVVFQTPVESITIEDDGNREAKCLFWDRVGQSLIHQTRIAQVLY